MPDFVANSDSKVSRNLLCTLAKESENFVPQLGLYFSGTIQNIILSNFLMMFV